MSERKAEQREKEWNDEIPDPEEEIPEEDAVLPEETFADDMPLQESDSASEESLQTANAGPLQTADEAPAADAETEEAELPEAFGSDELLFAA